MAKQRETKFEHITKNFHDEREWRFIPNFTGLDTDLELVIPTRIGEKCSQTSRKHLKRQKVITFLVK
ncbi:hypothetical protein D3C74_464940 [compost metagenome]